MATEQKIKDHASLVRTDGFIINKDDSEYMKRINTMKRNELLDQTIQRVESMEKKFDDMDSKLELILKHLSEKS